jgi:hypothetical protein
MRPLAWLVVALLTLLPSSGDSASVLPATRTVLGGPVPVAISFSPSAPTEFSDTPVASQVSVISVTMSDASIFAGTLAFASPNTDDGGRFALSGSNVRTNASFASLGGTTRHITVSATQNSTTVSASLDIAVTTAAPTAVLYNPDAATVLDNASIGTFITAVSVTMNSGNPFTGTLTMTNTDSGNFTLSGSNAVTNATPISPVGAHTIAVKATENGVDAGPTNLTVTVQDHTAQTQVTTQTIKNQGATLAASIPQVFGQGFAYGDLPGCLTDNYPMAKDHLGNALTTQLDDVSTWPDGSCMHVSGTIATPASISASATEQLQWWRVPGTYAAGTDHRSTADITGHDFQLLLTDVRNSAAATVGSGSITVTINTCVNDGMVTTLATGALRRSVMVTCPGIDPGATTTTLGAGISNSATGSTLVGSTAGLTTTTATTTDIVKVDSEYLLVRVVDATHVNIITRGALGSTAASHSNGATITPASHVLVKAFFDLYSDPANTANLYAIGSMPMVLMPYLNVVGADFYSYHAKYVDGVSTIRDWAATATVDQSTGISVAANTVTLPAFSDGSTLQSNQCVDFASSGTLPAPIVANKQYWLQPSANGAATYKLYAVANGSGSAVDITTTGSGTLTVTVRICQSYRTAWYSAANDQGHENFSASATALTSLYPCLDCGGGVDERKYWYSTGLIPPFDPTLVPNAMATANGFVGSTYDSTLYRPLLAIRTYKSIGSAGGPPGESPFPDWDAQAWLLQNKVSWDYVRAAGMGEIHMPWVGVLQEATARVQPFNNGASRFNAACVDSGTGRAYTQLGTPQPNWIYNGIGGGVSGILVPTSGQAAALSIGNFGVAGGDGSNPDQSHWPLDPYFQHLIFAKPWYLDQIYMSANLAQMIRWTPATLGSAQTNKQVQYNAAGTIYYAQWHFGQDRAVKTIAYSAMGATLGASSTRPEKALSADYLQENYCQWARFQSANAAALPGAGLWDTHTPCADGLTTQIGTWGLVWGKILTRRAEWDWLMDLAKQRQITAWGEPSGGNSAYFGASEYSSACIYQSVATYTGTGNWNGTHALSSTWIVDPSHIGITYPSGNGGVVFTATAPGGGAPSVFTLAFSAANLQTEQKISNGDKVRCMGNGGQQPGGTFQGPPECNPLTTQEYFFVCDLSIGASASTFTMSSDIGCTNKLSLATAITTTTKGGIVFHPITFPSTASCVMGTANCTNWSGATGQYGYYWPNLYWLVMIGKFSTSDAAVVNFDARVTNQIPLAQKQVNPRFIWVYDTLIKGLPRRRPTNDNARPTARRPRRRRASDRRLAA